MNLPTLAARARLSSILFTLGLAPNLAALPTPGDGPTSSAPRLSQREVIALAEADDLDRRVHSDLGADGALWTRGSDWKMRFDARGATYMPLLGPRQERRLPHVLSPASVRVGGRPLAFLPLAPAVLADERVEIDRGSFVEAYELAPGSVEQLFVFERIPAGGDLVIRIDTGSELEVGERNDALEFRGELGGLTYSRAVAIDSRGRRAEAPTRLVGSAIEIRVAAEFLASAQAPLVLDPVVWRFSVDTSSLHHRRPDVAYDATTGRWLVVFEERISFPFDVDVAYKLIGDNGYVWASGYVNLDDVRWTIPRCANLNAYDNFLVVASCYGSPGWRIFGRLVYAANGSLGAVSAISDPNGNDQGAINGDVGGDPTTSQTGAYCVVYERLKSSGDSDINFRLVSGFGAPLNAYSTQFSPSVVSRDLMPAISKSNDGREWGVVFDRDGAGTEQVGFGRIDNIGNVSGLPYAVMTSAPDNFGPRVSSPLDGTPRYLIATVSSGDVLVAAMNGYSKLVEANLGVLETGGAGGLVQEEVCVDSDGTDFVIAYAERVSSTNRNVVGTALRLSGSSLLVRENRLQLRATVNDEFQPALASKDGAGLPGNRFLIAWGDRYAPTDNYNVWALLYATP